MIDPVNSAERFLAASKARDVEAAASELAADVVMHNPATDDPVVGKDAVAAGLRAVEAACDEFRHTHLLMDTSSDGKPLFGIVFEAKIGDSALYGVDIIELDDHDRISSFTVLARPIAGLMALGARMSEQRSDSR
jgi:hypothetical protein